MLTSGTVGEFKNTIPASPRALIAAGLAEFDNEQSRDTIPREVDDCSSAGSESCWGEMEDIGDDEVPEWGVLPPLPDSNMFAPLADAEIVEVARRHGGIQSRSDHVPVVAMDVNDSESEVSMVTALEQDLAVWPWEDAQAEFQNVQRRVQDGDRDAPTPSVERTDGWRRTSRRVALIPGSEGGTPRSIQDRLMFPVQCHRRLVLVTTEPTWETNH